MEHRVARFIGEGGTDLLTLNVIIWLALLIAVSIVLWDTSYLLQAVPVVALAAVASNALMAWGLRQLQEPTY